MTFTVGLIVGLAPFIFWESLTYLIPLSLRDVMKTATPLLGGLIALIARSEPLGRRRRQVLQVWSFGAVAGLILLAIFQSQPQFIVRFPHFNSSGLASEVIAGPRLKDCPCKVADADEECVPLLTAAPADMRRCWDESRRRWNRLAWTLGYLLLVGGGQSFLGLLWGGSFRRARAVSQPTGATRTLFLSYSRLDRDFAERLASDLQQRGIAVWWDFWEMEVGDSLPRKIEEAVSRSAWFGIVLSPDAVSSPWVRAELDLALTMEIEGGITILPILHRPCELPLSLRGKVWADFTSSYQESLESLLRRLA